MIILHVTYRCKPALREAFLARIRAEGVDKSSRAEDGNEQYDYYFPCEDRDTLLLIEQWHDAAALAAHGKTAHFARLTALKAAYVDETKIERFETVT